MDISEVKNYLNKVVKFQDGRDEYEQIFTGCILRIRDNKFYYQAELTDKCGRSIMIRPLKDIHPLKDEGE